MKPCLETLSANARRAQLGESERRQLEISLLSSVESRLLHEAGCAFDAEDSWLAGDDVVAERVTAALLARHVTRISPKRRWAVGMSVAAFLLVATVGTAAAMRGSRWFRTKAAPAAPAAVAVTSAVQIFPQVKKSVAQPAASSVEISTSQSAVAARAIPSPTSAELFAKAALARRQGQIDRAIVLYDTLQSRFPSATESRAADIALGMLHLGHNNPGAAFAHFQRYLQISPDGELAAEALFGQARALAGLGRASQARQSWSQLLERFPHSAYADAARSKLGVSP